MEKPRAEQRPIATVELAAAVEAVRSKLAEMRAEAKANAKAPWERHASRMRHSRAKANKGHAAKVKAKRRARRKRG